MLSRRCARNLRAPRSEWVGLGLQKGLQLSFGGSRPIGPRFYMIPLLPYLEEMNIIVIIRIYLLGVITQCTRYHSVPRPTETAARTKVGHPADSKGQGAMSKMQGTLFSAVESHLCFFWDDYSWLMMLIASEEGGRTPLVGKDSSEILPTIATKRYWPLPSLDHDCRIAGWVWSSWSLFCICISEILTGCHQAKEQDILPLASLGPWAGGNG